MFYLEFLIVTLNVVVFTDSINKNYIRLLIGPYNCGFLGQYRENSPFFSEIRKNNFETTNWLAIS